MEELNRKGQESIYKDIFESNGIDTEEFKAQIQAYEKELERLNKELNKVLFEEKRNNKKKLFFSADAVSIIAMTIGGLAYEDAAVIFGIVSIVFLGKMFYEKDSYYAKKDEIDEIKRELSDKIKAVKDAKESTISEQKYELYKQINKDKPAFDKPIFDQKSAHIKHETIEAIVDGAVETFKDSEEKKGPTLTLLK